jgi:hypothetical protein
MFRYSRSLPPQRIYDVKFILLIEALVQPMVVIRTCNAQHSASGILSDRLLNALNHDDMPAFPSQQMRLFVDVSQPCIHLSRDLIEFKTIVGECSIASGCQLFLLPDRKLSLTTGMEVHWQPVERGTGFPHIQLRPIDRDERDASSFADYRPHDSSSHFAHMTFGFSS